MSVIELVNTLTPFLYNLLIVLDTEAVLPGIGDEEKIRTGKKLVRNSLISYAFILAIDLVLAAVKSLVS